MTPTIEGITDVHPYEDTMSIVIGDGKILNVTHIGNVTLILWKNLISIQKLTTDLPYNFSLQSNVSLVKNVHMKKSSILSGNSVRELYYSKIIYNDGRALSMEVWHDRLCHLSNQTIQLLKTQAGINEGKLKNRQSCCLGKCKKLPLKRRTNYVGNPHERLYIDFWGTASIPSWSGKTIFHFD